MTGVQECHEEVFRDDEAAPCERVAYGYRLDPESHHPYPVCKRHLRPPLFVPTMCEVHDLLTSRGES